MKILVTGASGMLGRCLAARLSKKHEVTGVSKSGRAGTVAVDLSQEDRIRGLFGSGSFGAVIHTAAYSDVDGCERDPQLAYDSNVLASRYLAAACGEKKIPLVYVSTDYVFDGKRGSPYGERDLTLPINIYGMTKLGGEYEVRLHAPLAAIVRTSWLFGPENPKNFVNWVVAQLLKEKKADVLDDQQDSPTYVADLSEALEKITERLVGSAKKEPPAAGAEIFHVCNAGSATRYGMTLKIKELLGLAEAKVGIIDKKALGSRPALRPVYAVMSTRHYEKTFRVKLRRWEDSMKDYLNTSVLCGS